VTALKMARSVVADATSKSTHRFSLAAARKYLKITLDTAEHIGVQTTHARKEPRKVAAKQDRFQMRITGRKRLRWTKEANNREMSLSRFVDFCVTEELRRMRSSEEPGATQALRLRSEKQG